MVKSVASVIVMLLISQIGMATAEVPGQFSYQGVLRDSDGNPVADAVYSFKFKIYSDSSAGSILWETAGFVPIRTSKGLFDHLLGSNNPIPESITNCANIWVGVTVDLGEELAPRTRLVSVPYSLKSIYAERAGSSIASQFADSTYRTVYAETSAVSLDKTINAGDLILGNLDTARYSAYRDIVSENEIGTNANQLAAGNHTHIGISFPGTMHRVEDTTIAYYDVPPNPILKTITIPSGQIGSFFRITFPFDCTYFGSGTLEERFEINGVSILVNSFPDNGLITKLTFNTITFLKKGPEWYIYYQAIGDSQNSGFVRRVIDDSNGFTISLKALCTGGFFGIVASGTLILEYDID
jgi:hypothetical protein